MAYKVWYRYRGQLEVDVVEGRKAALRRAASIFINERTERLSLTGIEADDGHILDMDDFAEYLRGYRKRGLDSTPTPSPKWFVEVLSPVGVREDFEDEWVRYAIEQSEDRARHRAAEAEQAFGSSRVRVAPALAVINTSRTNVNLTVDQLDIELSRLGR